MKKPVKSAKTSKPIPASLIVPKKSDWTIPLNGSKSEAQKQASEFKGITALQRAAVIEAINSIDGPFVSGTISGHKDGSGFLSVSLVGRTVRGD